MDMFYVRLMSVVAIFFVLLVNRQKLGNIVCFAVHKQFSGNGQFSGKAAKTSEEQWIG